MSEIENKRSFLIGNNEQIIEMCRIQINNLIEVIGDSNKEIDILINMLDKDILNINGVMHGALR